MQEKENCKEPICKDNPFGAFRRKFNIQEDQKQCPLERSQLGRASWSLIHTFTAYYPQNPTTEDQNSMQGFLLAFKNLYPCKHCRGHFQKDYERDPPNLKDHKQLNLWACRQHNYTNKILGKSQFTCEYEQLMERWKTGCDADL